jgi:hypothetical protein
MAEENEKIEVSKGAALAEQFKDLTDDQQEMVLSSIGLERDEPQSAKEKFRALPKEDQKLFKEETGSKNIGLIKSAGKAFSNLADKLETNIEKVMDDPGKRAMFYSGLNIIDDASRIKPISQAQSPFGMVAKGIKTGVQKVKAEDLAKANVEAKLKSAEMKNLLEGYKLELEKKKETPAEIKMYGNIYERYKDDLKGTKNFRALSEQAKLYNKYITENNSLPVGQIRSKLPVLIQSVSEILPANLRKDNKFFELMSDEASFIKNLQKFQSDIVLGDISQLVPVSDKDIQIKRESLPGPDDTAKVLTYSLRTQGGINLVKGFKYSSIDDYRMNDGLRSKQSFDNYFNTKGVTDFKNSLTNQFKYTDDQIREEAKKLGFEPDYTQYTDTELDFSPLALAEAVMSLQMGGYDKYINVGVTDISGDKNKGKITTDTETDTITEYDQDKYKKDLDELNKKIIK